MRLRGTICDFIVLADGRQRITIETKDDFRPEYDRLREREIVVDPRVYRRSRSLDANAYFHLLVNKIAGALRSDDDAVKKRLVVRYGALATDDDGAPVGAMLPAGTEIDRYYPYSRAYKQIEMNGRRYVCYLLYKRTRDLDSAEMARLIDGAISEAKELGIETMPPDELAALEAAGRR